MEISKGDKQAPKNTFGRYNTMKKLIAFLAVALLTVGLTISTYAQGEPEADIGSQSNPNASVGTGVNVDDILVDDAAQGDSERYPSVMALFQYWEENGYPDYVGGVINGNTILLVNDDGSMEEAIRISLVENSGVSFGSALYSYNTLTAINNEIVANYLGKDENVKTVSVGWDYQNGVLSGFGESGNEFRVIISVDEAVATEYANRFYSQYGDKVVVKAGGGIVLDDFLSPIQSAKNTWQLPLFISMIALACVSILFFNRTRLIPAMQTANGNIVTGNAPMSKKQTVAAIKNSAITPSDDVFNSIMEKIEKVKK
jgi:hypothetical protein